MGGSNTKGSQAALAEAIRNQDEDELQRLLKSGKINLNQYDPESASYPIEASANWLNGLTLLLDGGADVQCSGLIPALHVAAMSQSTDCIDLLLTHGANVDAFCAIGGKTALMEVACMQHPCRDPDGAAARLLTSGANPDLVNFAGDTAHDIARFAAENRQSLVETGSWFQPHEFHAAMAPVHRCVTLLANATGSTTKEVDFWDLCPERYRAEAFVELAISKRIDWLQRFLELGHPVDAPDRLGSSAIEMACTHNDLTTVAYLLAAGADSDQRHDGKALEDFLWDGDGDAAAIRTLLAEYRRGRRR